ncbi:MAG: AsmA-like C-terminal region-containing protein, partial [Gammaproteobacteria bacterium]|nr:AsmA-like C-terminal region-containing protein [Gammaproteobacteria bacterium]
PQVQQLPTGLPANLWQTYGVDQRPMSWLRLQGRLPSDYALSKLSLSHLQLEPWLPKRPQIDVSVPVCLLISDQCQLAMGSFKFAPEDVNWPETLKPAPEVSWLWQRQADQQALYISNAQQHMALAIDSGRLTGLGIGLAQIAPTVDTGTHIIGHIAHLDAPYWLGLMQGDDTGAKGLQIPTLQKLAILVEQLQWQDVLLNNAQLNYTLADKGWSFELLSDAAKGQVVSVDDGSPWQVNVDYLRIQLPEVQDEDADVEKVDLLAAVDPALLPDMDVDVLEIMKNQQSYGHWRLKARNQDGKVYLHDIEADLHNSHLSGNMTWGRQGLSHETMFSGRVLSQGVAETLSGWGYSPTIDSNYGALEAQLTWPASPLAFDIEAATGDFDLRIKQGEFFETPNLAGGLKVLSLLDMGRLLQRIRLDFTDIFSDEYQFDSIHAHYNMADGRARTVTPATFKSSSLELNLDGFIDFNSRTIDNDLFITLPVADKLSFVALLAGLPQLSGVLYVVDKLVGDELSTFTTARYRVAGDLDRPDLDLQQIFDANNQPKSLDERLNNVIKFQ